MVMLLIAINKLTNTDTWLLYGTYGIYKLVCYCTHICSVMGQASHMIHTGLICPGDMMNNNQECPLDGIYPIYDWTGYDLYHTLYATYVIKGMT